ncbi:alpha-mannosidase [Phormidium sp. CCY1219]|nr:alpha-mannosidase [Phormidium sp. CCY1219]
MTDYRDKIYHSIARLRQLTQVNAIARWKRCDSDLPVCEATNPQVFEKWPIASVNHRAHVNWASGSQGIWLAQQFVAPSALHGYPLAGCCWRLALSWWAEDAQIFVNGQLVQRGDLFDCNTRLCLHTSVSPNAAIAVAIRLVSPGHDRGALVRSLCLYEQPDSPRIDPGFLADELAVFCHFAPRNSDGESQLATLSQFLEDIPWNALPHSVPQFERSLFQLRTTLRQTFHTEAKIFLMGHAHLDLAWLWPISETWDAAQSTFASVLNLMEAFPQLTFSHSTAALYAWIEENRPDMFAAIARQVKAGRWEVAASLWVEPELNIIGGESIARQVLYGQRYCLEKFGQLSPVAWLPDSFGFCWQLPQFFKLGGIEYFVTQKLRWNDTTEFPYDLFQWRSPDGTEIFSLMSAPIGEGIDPVKMADYAANWQQKTRGNDCLWLPGVGDHGGGPTRDMLELSDRWQSSPFFPPQKFTTASAYLQHLHRWANERKNHDSSPTLPVWNDELYLEFHRGCYTTHGDQKSFNRRCEQLLYEAELFSALATIIADAPYPKSALETAWKQVLFNQFHDILPGSAIPEVYREANENWRAAKRQGKELLNRALHAISPHICPAPLSFLCEAQPIIVFNSLNWQRSEIVAIELPESNPSDREWQVYNSAGKSLRSQRSKTTLFFAAENIPSIGYRVFWLMRSPQQTSPSHPPSQPKPGNAKSENMSPNILSQKTLNYPDNSPKQFILENPHLRVEIDPKTGEICRLFDKKANREVLTANGNQLQAFEDSGQYWDAWNIDPNYPQYPLPAPRLQALEWVERGELLQRLRVVRKLGESEFIQEYRLAADSSVLTIANQVNWQGRHVMVKAAFPVNLNAENATYEMPCGAIARPTKPQTPAEQAKWEVPAINWADISAENYGVSILSDRKYAYDAQCDRLRLTLLRGSTWPDPAADIGTHEFTYAIYPHSGNWKSAQTVRRGYELNFPLQVRILDKFSAQPAANKFSPKPTASFVDLSAENLVIMALKQAENNPQRWILRCYESMGEEAQLTLTSDVGLQWLRAVDILEREMDSPENFSEENSVSISPWKISSFECISR